MLRLPRWATMNAVVTFDRHFPANNLCPAPVVSRIKTNKGAKIVSGSRVRPRSAELTPLVGKIELTARPRDPARVKREETLLPFNGMFNGPINACKRTSRRGILKASEENNNIKAPSQFYTRSRLQISVALSLAHRSLCGCSRYEIICHIVSN